MNNLPKMEFTFTINKKEKGTGLVREGDFTYRRLSIGSQGKADVMRTRLNGDLTALDPDIDRLHEMLGWLRFGLVDYPSWWAESKFGIDLYDATIVKEIYDSVSKFEADWFIKVEENAVTVTETSV